MANGVTYSLLPKKFPVPIRTSSPIPFPGGRACIKGEDESGEELRLEMLGWGIELAGGDGDNT
jgi:hypothetical protein